MGSEETYYSDQNEQRFSRGVEALNAYKEKYDRGEEDGVSLSDLLADLMHAGRGRYNFEHELDRARAHFYAELREASAEAGKGGAS